MGDGHCFISYSTADGLEFTRRLAEALEGGDPSYSAWYDKRDLVPSIDWDDQIVEAIKKCKCMLFLMTDDSTKPGSDCKQEIIFALRYKKPIVPLLIHKNAEPISVLGTREWINFTGDYRAGIAKLHTFLRELDLPEGILRTLNARLADAQHDLRHAEESETNRIKAEIEELKTQIEVQEKIASNPKAAEKRTEDNIQSGLERERQPEKPVAGKTSTRFINPPPGIAPNYFQNRLIETKQIIDFLNNDSQRLMTIVGRAGVGKTAMVCRLLKALERGELPDDLGEMKVDGIVYLSETGSHRVNFANVFADLSKLLPKDDAERLEGIYKNPQTSTGDKMRALLDAFPSGRVILLLDNFETLIDPESLSLRDSELSDALNALLGTQRHAVKAVITTRIAPRDLAVSEPGRQHHLSLDEGLESPYAENVLREMDADGRVGLKTAPDALLNKAREKTRGYPRALEALYAILSVDRYTTLEELLEISLPEEVVQKLVGEAFNRLDPSAQKVMQALAVYNRPVSPAAIDYLLQPHLPSIDSALVLNRLVNMHFARREAGRYYLHPADKEYAFSIIPEKDLTTKDTKVTKEKPKKSTAKTAKVAKEDLELLFESSRSLLASRLNAFTQHDLLNRAADYFAQARKPRTEWKKLDDLAAQLAEFELRCEGGDYDTAASVLLEIDFDYLLLWGHYRLLIDLHTRLKDKSKDSSLRMSNLNGLGFSHESIGKFKESIDFYQQGLDTARENKNRSWEGVFLGNLGNAYNDLGETRKAIEHYENALVIAREVSDRRGEGARLSNLGNAYADLGDTRKAIEYHELALPIKRETGNRSGEAISLHWLGVCNATIGQHQAAITYYKNALAVAREINDKSSEAWALGNLGYCLVELGQSTQAIGYQEESLAIRREISDRRGEAFGCGETGYAFLSLVDYRKAEDYFRQSIQISNEISSPDAQLMASCGLTQVYLFQNDLVNARASIEAALQYDVPENNHNASALHGIIALRQGERETAQEAFMKSIAQADEILAKTPDYYSALDAKGLSICGLTICDASTSSAQVLRLAVGRGAVPAPNDAPTNNTGRGDPAPTIDDAIETFRAARRIAPHAGVVKSVLRLFDELVKCDEEGVLKDVRKAVEGSDLQT